MISGLTKEILDAGTRFPFVGFLVFTRAHAAIVKMLGDRDLYAGLDEVSGERLAIFTTCLFEGQHKLPSLPPDMLGMMIPVWEEPSKNRQLLSIFGVDDSRDAFFVLYDVQTERHALHEVDDSSPDAAYRSLRGAIELVIDSDSYNKAVLKLRWTRGKDLLGKLVALLATLRGAAGV